MTSRGATMIIIGVILLVSATLLVGFVVPQWTKIVVVYLAAAAAGEQTNDLEVQRNELQRFVKDQAMNERLRSRLTDMIPVEPGTDSIILTLEQLSQTLGLQLPLLSVTAVAAGSKDAATDFAALPEGVAESRFVLDTTGSYPDIQQLIGQFVLGDRLLETGTVSLAADPEAGVTAHLELRAFYQPETTVTVTSQTLAIDPALRDRLLAPRSLVPLTLPTPGATGRLDPFAPVQ